MSKIVDEIKDFFESYKLMQDLLKNSEDNYFVKLTVYENKRKEVLNIKLIERSRKKVRNSKGIIENKDNLFCEFNLKSNRAKLTFKLDQNKMKNFNIEIKKELSEKFNCKYLSTNVIIELYSPRVKDVVDTFTTLEQFCRKE